MSFCLIAKEGVAEMQALESSASLSLKALKHGLSALNQLFRCGESSEDS